MFRSKLKLLSAFLLTLFAGQACLAAGPAATGQPGKPEGGGSAPAKTPIKIGFITSLSGVGALTGQAMKDGITLYFSKHQEVSGHPIKLVFDDDESHPSKGIAAVQRLINNEKVDVLSGFFFSPVTYSVAPIAAKAKIPLVVCVSGADDITQRKHEPWVLRTSDSASQLSHPFGEYVAKKLGYKRVVTIASDYAYSYEVVGGFQRTLEENGGKVIQKLWLALDGIDFSKQLQRIKPNADAIFVCTAGRTASLLPKQLKDSGNKVPVLGATPSFNDAVLAKVGDSLEGAISCNPYATTLSTPANKQFIKLLHEMTPQREPNWFNECGYTNGMWIAKAIESLNGDVSNKEKFLNALRHVELKDAPRGPIKLDDYGNPIENIYICKVVRDGHRFVQDVIYTYPMVSQFWKWKPKDYLAQPPYSKDYPPCGYCK